MGNLLLDPQERAEVLQRIGRWRLFFLSVSSLTMAWITATNQVDMSQLGWFDWLQTIIGCIGNWSVMMGAILLTQGKAVATGHIPGLEDVADPEEPTEIKTVTTTTVTPASAPEETKVKP